MSWIPNTQMAAGMKVAEAEAQALREALVHLAAPELGIDAAAAVRVAPRRWRRWLRRIQPGSVRARGGTA